MTNIFKAYMKVKDPDKAHAVLSASGSERWMSCAGSIKLSEGLPPVDNEHSIAGTNAHTLLQFILENQNWDKLLAHPNAKKFKAHIEYSEDQLRSVLVAAEFVKHEYRKMRLNFVSDAPELLIEQKVKLEGVGFGTSDVILYQKGGVLHVMDYKNGTFVVHPEENMQGMYYACAALDQLGWGNFKAVWITIMQPNGAHKSGPIRTWKTTLERLKKARRDLRLGAKRTREPNAPLVPDAKYCWFCPARIKCPAQLEKRSAKIVDQFFNPLNKEKGSYGKEESSKKEGSRKKTFCETY